MDEERIRLIVQKVLAELNRISPVPEVESRQEKSSAVVYFCGCPGLQEELTRDLSIFRDKFTLFAGCSSAAESLLGRDFIERAAGPLLSENQLYEYIDGADAVLFPNLSQNTAAKGACGIRDTPGSEIMGQALKKGKKVLACTSWICPGRKNDPYSLFLAKLLDSIEKIGVQLYAAGNLGNIFEKDEELTEAISRDGASSLITALSVREAKEKGMSSIKIEGKCIVTPLARDEARKLSIELPC